MSTYRTHFILNNTTPYRITGVKASDWNADDFGSDSTVNPYCITGTLEPGEQKDWALELVEGQDNDPFTLRIDFEHGHWLLFRHNQKDAYDNIDESLLVLGPGNHDLGGLGINVYRQCQKNLPKPDWGNVTVSLRHKEVEYDLKTWMSKLDENTKICDVNLPGSHDSAAISSIRHTPWACHQHSITDQLNGGVRMLDVRIKVKGTSSPFDFVTCHGTFEFYSGNNEYQSLVSLLEECKGFLTTNGSESIVMSLKIDDYNDIENNDQLKADAIKDLADLVGRYPTNLMYSPNHDHSIPTVKEAQGKICLLNRIEPWHMLLGAPINIVDNMTGAYLVPSGNAKQLTFKVYCQDKYSWGVWHLPNTPHVDKFELVKQAWAHKVPGEVLINFASGVYTASAGSDELLGFYINPNFLGYLGALDQNSRPKDLGWMLFDYAMENYNGFNVVNIIVASNFNYDKYPHPFQID